METLCPFATQDSAYDVGGSDGGSFTGGSARGVLHTTEGSNFAGARSAYVDNNSWPHFTVSFEGGIFQVRQHLPINVAARSLENRPGGVQTNRRNAIQIEIVGFAKKSDQFPTKYLDGLAKLMRWIEGNAGVASISSVNFNPFPGSDGLSNGIRLSHKDWDNYSGWLGHQHVPENEHGDPGNINIDHLLGSSTSPHQFKVISDTLNLRSTPEVNPTNILAALPEGHIVTKLGNSDAEKWWEVSTIFKSETLTGFVAHGFLAPS